MRTRFAAGVGAGVLAAAAWGCGVAGPPMEGGGSPQGPAAGSPVAAPAPGPPAAPPAGEPIRWAAPGEVAESGGLRATLRRASMSDGSPNPLGQDPPGGRRLVVVCDLANATATRKFDGVDGSEAEAVDDLGNRYRWLPGECMFFDCPFQPATLYPGDSALAGWVLERPVDAARTLSITIRVGPMGGDGRIATFRFRLPTAAINQR